MMWIGHLPFTLVITNLVLGEVKAMKKEIGEQKPERGEEKNWNRKHRIHYLFLTWTSEMTRNGTITC